MQRICEDARCLILHDRIYVQKSFLVIPRLGAVVKDVRMQMVPGTTLSDTKYCADIGI